MQGIAHLCSEDRLHVVVRAASLDLSQVLLVSIVCQNECTLQYTSVHPLLQLCSRMQCVGLVTCRVQDVKCTTGNWQMYQNPLVLSGLLVVVSF